ncbi:hypothetical protein MKX08_009793 [Trichoderma sp. CBMAI-0020]|nr:hypothetical protein MKX08_009793 [Trichoderma sp. CBMAI-0020]
MEDSHDAATQPPAKRSRRPLSSSEDRPDQVADPRSVHPVGFWAREGHWPRELFGTDMERALARKRFLFSPEHKTSDFVSAAMPSDQQQREEKNITTESKTLCDSLLKKNQHVPEGSLFRDESFEAACQKIRNGNEERVIRDISRLIVPSAESLATLGAIHLENLVESVNDGWNNSIPLIGSRPQPDYSVGFPREAFTDGQLARLSPFIGDIAGDMSLFMATCYMYFPFLACEFKCSDTALNVADRQNAHTMALAARGVVELFRLVKRGEEINRQILCFSVSHDHCSVRIYGYYPVIDGADTKYHRHSIHSLDFTTMDGKDRWTAYRFTKNIYDVWMPEHFKKICSAIDQLPKDVPALSESTDLC